MDHLDPAKETGSSTAEVLTTRCRLHNHYRAMLKYGPEYVRRRMDEDRRAREARRILKASSGPGTLCEPTAAWRAGFAGALAAGA
jgi:hypothetical protein